jgi:regulator of protease activity HflC (stomatin/prohibitin superfamily)
VSDRLKQIEEERAKRKEDLAAASDAQKAIDLEAISALEEEHGDSSVKVLVCPYKPGFPVAYAVRCPKRAEYARYNDRVKPKGDGKIGDVTAAADELAAVCRIYPPRDEAGNALYASACEVFPALNKQLGILAANMAAGDVESAGKG